MCYRISRDFNDIDVKKEKIFAITEVLSKFEKKYNVPITSKIPVIVPGSRILDTYKWGLIPHWAKDEKIAYKLANARSETLDEKPSFKDSFHKRRCLVLASGFFEWDNTKQPYYIQIKSQKIFAFAGLWDSWIDKDKKEIKSCTIITCEPNKEIKKLHDRMPVILKPDDYETWLKSEDILLVKSLLKPYKDDIILYKVSRDVNSVKYESVDSIKPIKEI